MQTALAGSGTASVSDPSRSPEKTKVYFPASTGPGHLQLGFPSSKMKPTPGLLLVQEKCRLPIVRSPLSWMSSGADWFVASVTTAVIVTCVLMATVLPPGGV
jgi:hypothetical protein